MPDRACLFALASAWLLAPPCGSSRGKDVRMPNGPLKLKPVVELIQSARQAGMALPDETHLSYPVPVPRPGGLAIDFLYCPCHFVAYQGLFLAPPAHAAQINAETGKCEELKAVTPAAYGRRDPPDRDLGKYEMPPGMKAEEFVAQQKRLYELYDQLLPAFAAGQQGASADVRKAAAEFQTLFARITEAPLQPYYQAVGKDFFDWLARAAR
jgi:hypothetical protein